ncbi:MAG TPA: cation transporter [Pyrinomonadaceae bacterium]
MSRRQMLIAFIFMVALTLCASTVFAATRTITIRVKGMTCGGCATTVEQAFKSTEGGEEARVNFERGGAVIKYDDQKVTVAKLLEIINNTGFTCEVK